MIINESKNDFFWFVLMKMVNSLNGFSQISADESLFCTIYLR